MHLIVTARNIAGNTIEKHDGGIESQQANVQRVREFNAIDRATHTTPSGNKGDFVLREFHGNAGIRIVEHHPCSVTAIEFHFQLLHEKISSLDDDLCGNCDKIYAIGQ